MTNKEILQQILKDPFKRGFFDTGEAALDRRHKRVIDSIIEYNTFLEIGPGIGKTALYLSQWGLSLELIDIDNAALKEFYEEVEWEVPLHIYKTLDQWSEIKDDSFDVVYACEVIEHIEDYQSMIHEMIRIAKHKIVLTTPMGRSFAHPGHKHCFNMHSFEFIENDYLIDIMSTKNLDIYIGQLVFFIEIYEG